MQRAAIIFAYFIFSTNCSSQENSTATRYNFKHINVQNGLVQNIVYHFLEDSHGYMWFGTHNGVTLHDGSRSMNFLHDAQNKSSIAGTFITSILEDSSKQVWIGNENGIDRFNRSSLSFTHFGIDRGDGVKLNTYCVALGFVSPDELLLLDTEKKSVRCLNTRTGASTFIALYNTNHALLYKDSFNNAVHLWSGYDKGTIHHVYKGKKLIKEEIFFDGKVLNQPELVVIHVLQQNDSTVWLSTTKGLVKLNPQTKKYRLFDSWQGQPVRELRYTVIADDNHLWVASGPDGIYKFSIKANQFVSQARNDKFDPFTICSNNIVSLYLDKMSNLWCGSYGNGLSYTNIRSSFFSSHIAKNETSKWEGNNSISLLGSDRQGNLWCTFQNVIGIATIGNNYRIHQYRSLIDENGNVFNNPIYKLIFETNDEAWLGSGKGLYLYNLKTNRLRPIPYSLISNDVQGSIWIKDMIRLKSGAILFSTYAGLYLMTNTDHKPVIKPISFLNPGIYNGFGKLAQDKQGLIYVASLADFVYVLRSIENQEKFELVTTFDFMPEINQFFGFDADSLMYIASDDGLYSINSNTLSLKKDDLDNRIPFISVSSFFRKEQKLWLFGEKGLYCYDRETDESRTFTMEDGLPANDFTASALVYKNTGWCIAGTSNGLVSFAPSQVRFLTNEPKVRFTAFYINDQLDTMNANPDEIKHLKLSSNQNTFSLDFAAISFFHANDCNFEYKLDGYDDDWIKSGTAHYTRYSKIGPGKYTFMLRVLDNHGNLSPYSKELEIEIAKSFWQTNFFRAGLFIVLLAAGWLFVKWYSNEKMKTQKGELEKLQAIEKERTRIATDMHDDLGAGLSRIKFLSETIGIKKQQQLPFEEDIIKIREYSHEMIDKMGEIVWALNEKNDSLSDLLSYIRVYAVGYLSQNGIKCAVKIPEYIPTSFVSGEFRRNVYLTVKEALHNVVKHSQATELFLNIQVNHQLSIKMKDNGSGFDKNNIRPFSNGLSNMESRIKEIGGKLEIVCKGGTVVNISVPLQT